MLKKLGFLLILCSQILMISCSCEPAEDGMYCNQSNKFLDNKNAHANVEEQFGIPKTKDKTDVVTKGCPDHYNEIRCKIFKDTNAARAKENLPALAVSEKCSNLAQAHAIDMKNLKLLTHDSPNYGSFKTRVKTFGISGSAFAENIYFNSKGSAGVPNVVPGWMKSPDHKANILSKTFKKIGIGESGGFFAQCFSN